MKYEFVEIEKKAQEIIEDCFSEFPLPIVSIVNMLGFDVVEAIIFDPSIRGFIEHNKITVSSGISAVEKRVCIAQALGLYHFKYDGKSLEKEEVSILPEAIFKSSSEIDKIAYRFAAALLIPKEDRKSVV